VYAFSPQSFIIQSPQSKHLPFFNWHGILVTSRDQCSTRQCHTVLISSFLGTYSRPHQSLLKVRPAKPSCTGTSFQRVAINCSGQVFTR